MCYVSVPSRVTSGPRLDVAGEQLMPLLQLRTQSSQLLQVVLQQLALLVHQAAGGNLVDVSFLRKLRVTILGKNLGISWPMTAHGEIETFRSSFLARILERRTKP